MLRIRKLKDLCMKIISKFQTTMLIDVLSLWTRVCPYGRILPWFLIKTKQRRRMMERKHGFKLIRPCRMGGNELNK